MKSPASNLRTLRSVGLCATLALILSGCGGYDFQLFVRNHTGQEWLVRTESGGTNSETFVSVIPPGAEGLALAWLGPREQRIELLNSDCTVAGVFEPTSGDELVVPQVAGIDASVSAYRFNDPWNSDEIVVTDQCGGVTYG
jgi:hypothetical protein